MLTPPKRARGRPALNIERIHIALTAGSSERIKALFPSLSISQAVRKMVDGALNRFEQSSAETSGRADAALAKMLNSTEAKEILENAKSGE